MPKVVASEGKASKPTRGGLTRHTASGRPPSSDAPEERQHDERGDIRSRCNCAHPALN